MSIAAALRSKNAEEFRLPCPAGEDNWKSRFGFLTTLESAIEQSTDIPANFSGSFEPFINNVLDSAISERTQLSNAACKLLGTVPKALGKDIHPYIDRLVPILIRQCASTKTVAQKSASAALSNIIIQSPFNARTLWHVCQAFEDKYSAPKLYAPGWLKLIIENYYPALNPDRDYEIISHAIGMGLEEADNNVRVNSRAVYWEYYKINPAGAEEITNKLNAHAKTALYNDPNNPDKNKVKTKKPEQDSALAQIKRERMKQKAAERNRVVSAKTITSDDFPMGQLDLADDKQGSRPSKTPHHSHATLDVPSTKTTSRPIAIHKKGSSHDGQVQPSQRKTTAADVNVGKPKKTGSTDSLRTSQNKKHTSSVDAESSTARPLLSAPVRRPRIVATPITATQSSSRPASRTGIAQTTITPTEPTLRSAISHRELKSAANQLTLSEPQKTSSNIPKNVPSRSEYAVPLFVPDGKENLLHKTIAKRNAPTSPDRMTTTRYVSPSFMPTEPPKEVPVPSDGLSTSHRLLQHNLDKEMNEMLPHMPQMAAVMLVQDDQKGTQMYHAYPDLNHDGYVDEGRRALEKALQYLNKDALDQMGFRKLRKLFESFGGDLIVDQTLYDLLFSELLPRLGTFEELLSQPVHETEHESHPRYIRQAVLSIVNVLVHAYPYQWSYQYQGPALASIMIARCAYTPNTEPRVGAPYVHYMTIVNQLNNSIQIIVDACLNPVEVLDSVLSVLAASEDFLMRNAPHDSESQQSWASFNPYSKINRLRTEHGIFHPLPKDLDSLEIPNPAPLPMKLPLLMETGLRIIEALIIKTEANNISLGADREDLLADLARHLMSSYNIIIRKQVMAYIQTLYRMFESGEKFWEHFPVESERNLIHYYLTKSR